MADLRRLAVLLVVMVQLQWVSARSSKLPLVDDGADSNAMASENNDLANLRNSALRATTTPISPLLANKFDQFGVRKLFRSVDPTGDWFSKWHSTRQLSKAFETDPGDGRAMTRGKGPFVIGNDQLVLDGVEPRYYIQAPSGGWMNTELTVYGRVDGWMNPTTAAITLISRSRHDMYKEYPCEAHGYYARIFFADGRVHIKKEFRHSSTGVIYSAPVRAAKHVKKFNFIDRFYGFKFVVRSNADGKSVNLRVYGDETEARSGGKWDLLLEYNDFNLAAESPTECNYVDAVGPADTQPVLRPGNIAILRSDDVITLHLKWASVREIPPNTA